MQDYANPITRFAIWDYPIDGKGGTSQVFHGSKMLDISSALVVPTVCVNDHIFFVDELLQTQDGTYFIPERFFYRLPDHAVTGVTKPCNNSSVYEPSVHDLWSLGRKVARTNVRSISYIAWWSTDGSLQEGFTVSDEKSTMHVDTFKRTFLDIQSDKREPMCRFIGAFDSDGSLLSHANVYLLRFFKRI